MQLHLWTQNYGCGRINQDFHVENGLWYIFTKNMLFFYTLTTNIATGETSQAITPYHFFNYFNFFGFYHKITSFLYLYKTFQSKDFITR